MLLRDFRRIDSLHQDPSSRACGSSPDMPLSGLGACAFRVCVAHWKGESSVRVKYSLRRGVPFLLGCLSLVGRSHFLCGLDSSRVESSRSPVKVEASRAESSLVEASRAESQSSHGQCAESSQVARVAVSIRSRACEEVSTMSPTRVEAPCTTPHTPRSRSLHRRHHGEPFPRRRGRPSQRCDRRASGSSRRTCAPTRGTRAAEARQHPASRGTGAKQLSYPRAGRRGACGRR